MHKLRDWDENATAPRTTRPVVVWHSCQDMSLISRRTVQSKPPRIGHVVLTSR